MIKSMTGFSSVSQEDQSASIGVTVRSVNHRYLDVQLRLPQSMAPLETRLRGCVQARAARGRVEVAVSVQMRQEPVLKIAINEAFTSALAEALNKAREAGLVQGALAPGDLLRFPQALTVREETPELDDAGRGALEAAIVQAVEHALDDLDAMRATEGAMLRADLDARKTGVLAAVEDVAARAAAGEAVLRERLARRVGDLAADLATDPVAVAQEVVRFAARSDISEEVVRFRAHVQQWTSLTEGPGAVRPQAGFPPAGDEPGSEHHRLQGRRRGNPGDRHRHQGRTREDARAGAECRVAPAAGRLFVVSAPSGAGKTTVVERLIALTPGLQTLALVHEPPGPPRRGRWRRLQLRVAGSVRGDDRRRAVSRVGRVRRSPLRHVRCRHRARTRDRDGPRAGHRGAGRAAGAAPPPIVGARVPAASVVGGPRIAAAESR